VSATRSFAYTARARATKRDGSKDEFGSADKKKKQRESSIGKGIEGGLKKKNSTRRVLTLLSAKPIT